MQVYKYLCNYVYIYIYIDIHLHIYIYICVSEKKLLLTVDSSSQYTNVAAAMATGSVYLGMGQLDDGGRFGVVSCGKSSDPSASL